MVMSLLIIVPEHLAASANALARAIGNEADQYTFTSHFVKDGQDYRAANFGVVPEAVQGWLQNPSLPEGAEAGQAALEAIGTEIQVIPHNGNAGKILQDMGFSPATD